MCRQQRMDTVVVGYYGFGVKEEVCDLPFDNGECGINVIGRRCGLHSWDRNDFSFPSGRFEVREGEISLEKFSSETCDSGEMWRLTRVLEMSVEEYNSLGGFSMGFMNHFGDNRKSYPAEYIVLEDVEEEEPECYCDIDCGEDYTEYVCSGGDVYEYVHDFFCDLGFCEENVFSSLFSECGEPGCGDFGENYCSEGDVYHSQGCYDGGCSEGECLTGSWLNEELVESCLYGCSGGECLPEPNECSCDEDCDDDYTEEYCYSGDVYGEVHDFSCSDGVCEEDIFTDVFEECEYGCYLGECLPEPNECSCDEDCGYDYSESYCVGDDLYREVHDFFCFAGECGENVFDEFVTVCGYGCSFGACNGDDVSPGSVTGLSVDDKGEDFIVWEWTNPSDEDFDVAIIYLDGVYVAETSGEDYSFSGLDDDTEYTITIHTKDLAGNLNDTDVSNTAKTLKEDEDDDDNHHNNDDDLIEDVNFYANLDTIGLANGTIVSDDVLTLGSVHQEEDYGWVWLVGLLVLVLLVILLISLILRVIK